MCDRGLSEKELDGKKVWERKEVNQSVRERKRECVCVCVCLIYKESEKGSKSEFEKENGK